MDYNKNNSSNYHNDDYEDLLDAYSEDYVVDPLKSKSSSTTTKNNSIEHVDRSQKVRNFSLHIDESLVNEYPDDGPTYKGEVYFSNQPVRRNYVKNQKNKFSLRIKSKKLLTTIAVSAALSIFISMYGISCMNDILAINRKTEIITVTIPENADTGDIIKILSKNDLINRRIFCNLFAKIRGYDKDGFLNGMYYLNAKMGLEGMLNQLKEAPKTAETVSLTFPEGWTVQEILDKLVKFEVCDRAILEVTLRDVAFDYSFLDVLPNIEKRYQRFEGYLYPDTYDFYLGENGSSVIKRFLNVSRDRWTDEYEKKAKELGYSQDEIIIIASIIQEEAANKEQMPLISSVLHNRLKNSVDFPLLQCDSTGLYLENNIKPYVDAAQYEEYKKLYDTSYCKGLPVGPICNPGNDAIEAALYPTDSNYLYFCHDNNRKIYMAETYAGHRNNWLEVLRVNNKS